MFMFMDHPEKAHVHSVSQTYLPTGTLRTGTLWSVVWENSDLGWSLMAPLVQEAWVQVTAPSLVSC